MSATAQEVEQAVAHRLYEIDQDERVPWTLIPELTRNDYLYRARAAIATADDARARLTEKRSS